MSLSIRANGSKKMVAEAEDFNVTTKSFTASSYLNVQLAVCGNIAIVRASTTMKKTLNKDSQASICNLGVTPLYLVNKRYIRNDNQDFGIEIGTDGTLKIQALKAALNEGDSINFNEVIFLAGGGN